MSHEKIQSLSGNYKYSEGLIFSSKTYLSIISWDLGYNILKNTYPGLSLSNISELIIEHIIIDYSSKLPNVIIFKNVSPDMMNALDNTIDNIKNKNNKYIVEERNKYIKKFDRFKLVGFYILTINNPIKIDQYEINVYCKVICINYSKGIIIDAYNLDTKEDISELFNIMNIYHGKMTILSLSSNRNFDSHDILSILSAKDCWKISRKYENGYTQEKINYYNKNNEVDYRSDVMLMKNYTLKQDMLNLSLVKITLIGDTGYILKKENKRTSYFHISPKYGLKGEFIIK